MSIERNAAIVERSAYKDNGPRYGVNATAGPSISPPVFAWFIFAPDALAYAEGLGLFVWDLVVGRRIEGPDDTDREPPPVVRYERAACPGCGATTVDEAERLCRPRTDETGEVSCAGGELNDGDGYLLQPRPDDLKRFDDWIDAQQGAPGPRQHPGPYRFGEAEAIWSSTGAYRWRPAGWAWNRHAKLQIQEHRLALRRRFPGLVSINGQAIYRWRDATFSEALAIGTPDELGWGRG